jgi:hypothetical protein
MKIEGPSKTSATSKTGKSEKAGESSGAFGEYMAAGGAKAPSAPASTSAIARVDALLAAQAVEDPTERAAKQRMRARADGILAELDKLKLALLTGLFDAGACDRYCRRRRLTPGKDYRSKAVCYSGRY